MYKVPLQKISIPPNKIENWRNVIRDLLNKKYLFKYADKSRTDLHSIENTIAYLKKSPAKTTTEKVWVCFCWMIINITYNMSLVRDGVSVELHLAEETFKSGISVCKGYCDLFQALCGGLDIEVVTVVGFVKGVYGSTIGDVFSKDTLKHVWSKVMVDGEWKLIDVCWAEGNGIDGIFKKMFQPYWFFTPPEIFANEHFPLLPIDQLIDSKLSLQEFEKMPSYSISFFM